MFKEKQGYERIGLPLEEKILGFCSATKELIEKGKILYTDHFNTFGFMKRNGKYIANSYQFSPPGWALNPSSEEYILGKKYIAGQDLFVFVDQIEHFETQPQFMQDLKRKEIKQDIESSQKQANTDTKYLTINEATEYFKHLDYKNRDFVRLALGGGQVYFNIYVERDDKTLDKIGNARESMRDIWFSQFLVVAECPCLVFLALVYKGLLAGDFAFFVANKKVSYVAYFGKPYVLLFDNCNSYVIFM